MYIEIVKNKIYHMEKKNLVINKEYTSIFQEKAKLHNLPNAHIFN